MFRGLKDDWKSTDEIWPSVGTGLGRWLGLLGLQYGVSFSHFSILEFSDAFRGLRVFMRDIAIIWRGAIHDEARKLRYGAFLRGGWACGGFV